MILTECTLENIFGSKTVRSCRQHFINNNQDAIISNPLGRRGLGLGLVEGMGMGLDMGVGQVASTRVATPRGWRHKGQWGKCCKLVMGLGKEMGLGREWELGREWVLGRA